MSVSVVDGLETVKINHDQAQRVTSFSGVGNGLRKFSVESLAHSKMSEVVAIRHQKTVYKIMLKDKEGVVPTSISSVVILDR